MPLYFTLLKCIIQCLFLIHIVWNHHCYQILEHFITPRRNPILITIHPPFPPPPPLAPDCHESTLCVYILPILDISYKHTQVFYCLRCLALSLSIMLSGYIHAVACISTSFLFMTEMYLIVWMYSILFIHQLMDIWFFPTF